MKINKKYTEKDEIDIKNLYNQGKNTYDLMRIYKLGYGTIWKILNRQNVIKRKSNDYRIYDIKLDFFEKINTEEKAYFLGWLYSDGNISKDLKAINLSLRIKDEEILIKLDKLIHCENTIRRNGKNSVLRIYSRKIAKDLIKLGCMPNKTFKIKFPSYEIVPKELMHHFIRGIFDGDGSIGHIKNTYHQPFANIVGTRHFCENLLKILKESNSYINGFLDYVVDKNTCVIRFTGNNVFRLFNYLYQNSTIMLERKYNNFQNEINTFKNTKKRRKNNYDIYDSLYKDSLLIKKSQPM